MLKIIIRKGNKNYELFGVSEVEPMAKEPGLCIYFAEKIGGQTVFFARKATIIQARECNLGPEFITAETMKALGW